MVKTLVSSCIMIITTFYIWNSWSTNKFSWKEPKVWLYILITVLFNSINYLNTNNLIKIINITLVFIAIYKYLFNKELKYSIIGPVTSQLLCFISETLFALIIFSILKDDSSSIVTNYFGGILANAVIATIMLLLHKIKFIKAMIDKFNSIISNVEETLVLFLSIIIILCYNTFALSNFYSVNRQLMIIISMSMTLILFILIFMFFKAKDDYYKICDKYNNSILSLKEFEDVLNNYRVDNHENRNHLLAIRNMTKNKKVISFIDTILDNKEKDNSSLMHETSIIPSGGLRGLIYSKMLVMKNKDIECELDVDRKVRTVELLDYGDDTLLDICKIIGIFLDNAIEEVEKLDEKYIIIEMFIEDDILKISITNIFDTSVDKSDIYKVGYSTKGDKHGYGLALVKKLTNKNIKLKTHHEINGDEFTQVLEILK